MKGLVFLGVTLLCASAVMAAEVDLVPGDSNVVSNPLDSPDFGELIRSFAAQPAFAGGGAVHPDGYITLGHWGSLFRTFYVYTTTGSLVRSISGLSGTSNGFRDASGRCHLGTGYFVSAQERGGIVRWTYTSGGTPGSVGTPLFTTARGRGVSYDGTYYYATQGGYGTGIGIYTTAGSLIRTIPGSSGTSGPWYRKYGSAMRFTQRDGYLVTTIYNYGIREGSTTTGSIRRSFSTGTSFAAGADYGWNSNKELYIVDQATATTVKVFNAPGGATAVAPSSLGKIKILYR